MSHLRQLFLPGFGEQVGQKCLLPLLTAKLERSRKTLKTPLKIMVQPNGSAINYLTVSIFVQRVFVCSCSDLPLSLSYVMLRAIKLMDGKFYALTDETHSCSFFLHLAVSLHPLSNDYCTVQVTDF